jgi:putative ABC transport system permease protein
MRARRRLGPGVADSFDLLSPTASRDFVASLTQRVTGAAAPLSAMALLASIVVVTNTTLVSVTQRTREIGVRRALGATRRQIVLEVLLESTLIALFGGLAGLLAVLGIGAAARTAAAVPLALTATTVLWSFGSAALAGVLAGLYPARRAARTDVIAAVRAE